MLILITQNGKQNFLVRFKIIFFNLKSYDLICNIFIAWPERSRQILKKWRTLSPEQKGPFLLKARENRTNLRQKKAQQVCITLFVLFLMEHQVYYYV